MSIWLELNAITLSSVVACRAKDDRDVDGRRLQSVRDGLEAYKASRYAGVYNFEIIAEENQVPEIAQAIYANYLQLFREEP